LRGRRIRSAARKGDLVKVLADITNVDSSTGEYRSPPRGLPVRRIGLEQEFFLVDQRGAPRDLADPFLRECREAARAEGLDPRSFEAECAKGMVEITTLPSHGVVDLARNYLGNLNLALGVASELGLALYPLGTYPLPIRPLMRDEPACAVKASTIGKERFSHAGRCAGTHLHLELPPARSGPT
jgi:gamma-glutamyl:cysteine ligase YbdK (ATP-grasp superfamily)